MKTEADSATECVIVINCGSSSLKFAVFPTDGGSLLMKGLAERLGNEEAVLTVERGGEKSTTPIPGASHRAALEAVLGTMGGMDPRGIGHRVVHGGEDFTGAAVIDGAVIDAVQRCAGLAPLHNPANLTGMETARELFPGLPQVAVFDTAFHQTLPPEAFLYAIPREYHEKLKARRYGFHGTSHHYVSLEAAKLLGKPPEETNLITIHLGNGCSACAIKDGRSVDTTMGLTPGEGLVMGTRSGDVDPGLHQFLQEQTGMRLKEITSLLNTRSGLLGVSGISNDMRTLEKAAEEGHAGSKLAIGVFCYRLAKAVCGLMAALDRIDALVFTGGIGENSTRVRTLTTARMRIAGVDLDERKNIRHGRDDGGWISSAESRIPCLVIPTNEELMIARETLRLISPASGTP